MTFKIKSGGTAQTTRVFHNGEELNNVESIDIQKMCPSELVTATIRVLHPTMDIDLPDSQVTISMPALEEARQLANKVLSMNPGVRVMECPELEEMYKLANQILSTIEG